MTGSRRRPKRQGSSGAGSSKVGQSSVGSPCAGSSRVRGSSAQPATQFTLDNLREITENFVTKIGEGGNAVVYKGEYQGKDIAVKFYKENKKHIEQWQNEKAALEVLRRDNVISFIGYGDDDGLCIVTEYIPLCVVTEMELDRISSPREFAFEDLREFSFEDLDRFTNGFSVKNLIGVTQFGKVYRGKISQDENGMEPQEVTVKIFVDRELYLVKPGDKMVRAKEEVHLLHSLISHPNLVKLIGYCCEGEQVGVVYDLKSLDTVYNLIFKESFTWMRRIKVAVEFARLVDFLHNEKHNSLGYLVRNIGPAHIMLDQEFCPRLIDFGMLSGGRLPDKRNIKDEMQFGSYGYMDPWRAVPGSWIEKCDVFSFGCVLIGLICKRVFNEKDDFCFEQDFPCTELIDWARAAYIPKYHPINGFRKSKCSLVHESLKADDGFYPSDGIMMTRLMIRCVAEDPHFRPTMKEVVRLLLELRCVRLFADELGLKQIVDEYATPL